MTIVEIVQTIQYAGLVSAGLFIIMLLLSLMGGDIDIDLDMDTDADIDGDTSSNSLGIIKSILVFVAVGCLSFVLFYADLEWSWIVALLVSIGAGTISVAMLAKLFSFLLSQQSEGNWYLSDAINEVGKVYMTIPSDGYGKVTVPVKGTNREIRAVSLEEKSIPSRTTIQVVGVDEERNILVVTPVNKQTL